MRRKQEHGRLNFFQQSNNQLGSKQHRHAALGIAAASGWCGNI
jgi:hypothetical protein